MYLLSGLLYSLVFFFYCIELLCTGLDWTGLNLMFVNLKIRKESLANILMAFCINSNTIEYALLLSENSPGTIRTLASCKYSFHVAFNKLSRVSAKGII